MHEAPLTSSPCPQICGEFLRLEVKLLCQMERTFFWFINVHCEIILKAFCPVDLGGFYRFLRLQSTSTAATSTPGAPSEVHLGEPSSDLSSMSSPRSPLVSIQVGVRPEQVQVCNSFSEGSVVP